MAKKKEDEVKVKEAPKTSLKDELKLKVEQHLNGTYQFEEADYKKILSLLS